METSGVTYQDLVREIWRVPTNQLEFVLALLRFLQTQAPQKSVGAAPTFYAGKSGRPIKARPASVMAPYVGSMDFGSGNALEDSERLYD